MAEATDLIPLINGIEYSWGDITATVGGVPVVGITAIEYVSRSRTPKAE